ncbi:MAG: hypothetical protein ACI909_002756 [Planctomycetota bacterium]|jgi:hypothetical protein
MSQDKNDQDMDSYLQGDSDLSRNYHLTSSELPSARVDDAILAASCKAVQSKPRSAHSPFGSNWHVPLSMAAVLVLCVTIFVTMQRENNDVYLQPPSEYRAKSPDEQAEVKSALVVSESEEQLMKDRAVEEREILRAESDASFSEAPFVSAPTASVTPKLKSAGKTNERILDRKMLRPEMRSMDTNSTIQTMDGPVKESYAPALADIQSAPEPQRLFKSDERANQNQLLQSEGRMESKKRESIDFLAEDSLSGTLTGNGEYKTSTEDWLNKIKQFWVAGNKREALQELQQFRKHYPDYEADELLRQLGSELIDAAEVER